MVAINVSLGSGANERASVGKIAIRPLFEYVSGGGFLALSAFVEHALSSEPLVWDLPVAQFFQVREIEPRGKTRVFQVPAVTTDYAALDWIEESPAGMYVIEPEVTQYGGASGEPGIAVGEYWIANNPAHPNFGYLLRKDS